MITQTASSNDRLPMILRAVAALAILCAFTVISAVAVAASPQQATSNDSTTEPAQPTAVPPGQDGSRSPSSGASTPGSNKPAAGEEPPTPAAPRAPANRGETDGVIRNALTGPESIPNGRLA